jgi:hypothetical protein
MELYSVTGHVLSHRSVNCPVGESSTKGYTRLGAFLYLMTVAYDSELYAVVRALQRWTWCQVPNVRMFLDWRNFRKINSKFVFRDYFISFFYQSAGQWGRFWAWNEDTVPRTLGTDVRRFSAMYAWHGHEAIQCHVRLAWTWGDSVPCTHGMGLRRFSAMYAWHGHEAIQCHVRLARIWGDSISAVTRDISDECDSVRYKHTFHDCD